MKARPEPESVVIDFTSTLDTLVGYAVKVGFVGTVNTELVITSTPQAGVAKLFAAAVNRL